jgi:hypothetical protein
LRNPNRLFSKITTMTTRNGKVANLPNDIREQLNLRLLEGETGKELAAWLNGLPAVQSVLGSQFNGSPVSEVNLTHWRQGGYLQWLTERECFDSARALADGVCHLADASLSAERLLNVLTLRFGQLLMSWDSVFDENVSEISAFSKTAKKARILQGISRSVLAIHRIQSQQRCSAGIRPVSSPAGSGLAPASPAGAERNTRPETDPLHQSPRPASPRRAPSPKLEPGLTVAALHPFLAHGPSGANPKILSGPIAPSSVHSKLSHTLAEVANAV